MEELLRVVDLWKIYPNGIVANRGVSLEIRRGEVLALLGENGAGKTTLVSIIAGYQEPTRGKILFEGKPYKPRSPRDAIRRGIVMVPQHPRLVDSYTVYENIGVALYSAGFRVARRNVRSVLESLIEKYGLSIDLDAPVGSLSVGEKQRVEIIKALALNPKLLILDEPSTHLTPSELEALVRLCRKLALEGRTVVYITHRIPEAMSVADRIAVMRSGRIVSVLDSDKTSPGELIELMFGEKVDEGKLRVRGVEARPGRVVLEARNLWVRGWHGGWAVRDVSLTVREGEVLGIAGIAGNGQRELFEVLVGVRRPDKGSIVIDGVDVTRKGSDVRLRLGLAVIPEERLGWALVPSKSIAFNAGLGLRYSSPSLARILVDWDWMRKHAERIIEYMGVEAKSVNQPVDSLSGGNMQRLVVGREILRKPRILVAMNPTSGLDALAAERVRREIVRLASKGTAVILFSEDLDEVFEVSTRIAVMSRGRIVALFERPFTPRKVVEAIAVH